MSIEQELADLKREFRSVTARLYDLSRYCEALQRDNDEYHRKEKALRFVINPPAWDIYDRDLTEVQKFLKDFKPTDEPPPPGLIMEQTRLEKPEYFGPLAVNDRQLAKNMEFMAAQLLGISRAPQPGDLVTAAFGGQDFGRFKVAADGRTLIPYSRGDDPRFVPQWPITPPTWPDRSGEVLAPNAVETPISEELKRAYNKVRRTEENS